MIEGAFGIVEKTDRGTVIKCVKSSNRLPCLVYFYSFFEIAFLSYLSEVPGVVKMTGSEWRKGASGGDGYNIFIEMEEHNKCLFEIEQNLLQSQFHDILNDLILTLSSIHARGVAHLDVKASNILYDISRNPEGEKVKLTLIDFGLSIFYPFLSSESKYRKLQLLQKDCHDLALTLLTLCFYDGDYSEDYAWNYRISMNVNPYFKLTPKEIKSNDFHSFTFPRLQDYVRDHARISPSEIDLEMIYILLSANHENKWILSSIGEAFGIISEGECDKHMALIGRLVDITPKEIRRKLESLVTLDSVDIFLKLLVERVPPSESERHFIENRPAIGKFFHTLTSP